MLAEFPPASARMTCQVAARFQSQDALNLKRHGPFEHRSGNVPFRFHQIAAALDASQAERIVQFQSQQERITSNRRD